jgi:nucleoid-associated protein YgaU
MSGQATPPARPGTGALHAAAGHRALWLVVAGIGTAAVAGAATTYVVRHLQAVVAPPAATAEKTPLPSAAPEAPPAPAKPVFDIVRVDPHGGAVMAGRAAPGAEVTILEGDKAIGHATADGHGDWVFTPDKPLAPGSRALTLSERNPDGQELKGDATVFLVVPSPAEASAPQSTAPGSPALALLTRPSAASRVLQGPGANVPNKLGLGTVDYDQHGDMHFAGNAKPGTSVRVYVDNQAVGDATAGSDGRWTLVPQAPIAPGPHQLRLDELAASGQVTDRVELPFTREAPQAAVLAQGSLAGNLVVQPGQNLWVIARQAYGTGVRYTVIYQANRSQIRDPNLIYPGQLFSIPAREPATVTPVSSSKSR